MNYTASFSCAALALSIFIPEAWAQACVKPADADWKKVVLVDKDSPGKLDKPTGMSILPDGRVFLSEVRSGRIKLFTPGSGLTEVGLVSPDTGVGNGFLGLALDPAFATHNWVYVFYARKLPGPTYSAGDGNVIPHEHVLARMTFANGKLGNMKEILSFKRLTRRHGGGGMAFNSATGELYIPTGDDVYPLDLATHWGGRNEAREYLNNLATSANTNDLRGKVLRIKPIPFPDTQSPSPGVGTTYTIPAGNLFPLAAGGGPGLAKTRPEIYTMGHRNPYKVKIDPVSGIALVGEVGPDADGPQADRGPTGSDEFNLVTGPGNYGWPFAIADNQPYVAYDGEAYPKGTVFDLKNLKNKSKYNTGIEDLPPAVGAMAYYNARYSQTGPNRDFGSGGESAIAGPYYRFDAAKPAAKLPPFFHGKYIVGDWSRGKIWALELDAAKALKKVESLWNVAKIIDLEIGPDGDLYVLTLSTGSSYEGDNNTGILYKMQYGGSQYPASACTQYVLPQEPTGIVDAPGLERNAFPRLLVNPALSSSYPAPAGAVRYRVYDVHGAKVWEGQVRSGRANLPGAIGGTLGFLQFN